MNEATQKDLARVETRIETLTEKVDDVLRILGKVEPFVDEVPKLRDKVGALEVANAELKTQITQANVRGGTISVGSLAAGVGSFLYAYFTHK